MTKSGSGAPKMTLKVSTGDAKASVRWLGKIYTEGDATEKEGTPLPDVDERQGISDLVCAA